MVKRRVWPGIVVSLLCVIFLALPPASGTSHASFPFTPTQTTAPSASASEGPAAGNPTLYGNTTVELPGFECYGEYQNKPGGANDCQTPILSWTQDGVYYVNATSVRVFYSFANSTVYGIHPWTMLWQRFPSYDMIPNELFITQDGTYVYSWGTLTKNSTTITGEAVNVSTDRIFEHNFTGVNTSNYTTNGQISMIGFDGNDSWMSLIEASAHILAYNIWSGVQSHGPVLGFFEANNVYWMPYLNAYVNVEAQGS